jgi:hypothetical protein
MPSAVLVPTTYTLVVQLGQHLTAASASYPQHHITSPRPADAHTLLCPLHTQEQDSRFWLETLGVAGAPAVVFFKGPGTQPVVVHQPVGGRLDLARLLRQDGQAWQVVPRLSGATDVALGCSPTAEEAGQVGTCGCVLVGAGVQCCSMCRWHAASCGRLCSGVEWLGQLTVVEA